MPDPTPLLAGKYANADALVAATIEARKKLDMPSLTAEQIFGDKGLYKDITHVEAEYKALERSIGKPKEKAPAPAKSPADDKGEKSGADQNAGSGTDTGLTIGAGDEEELDAVGVLKKAELDPAAVQQQFMEHGDLTDEQYAAIRKAKPKFTKSDIKQYAQGLVAQAELQRMAGQTARQQCEQIAGGADELKNLLADADSFLSPEEKTDYDARVKNPRTAAAAVRALVALRKTHDGSAGSRPLLNGTTRSSGGSGAKTNAEFMAAARRYSETGDPAAKAVIDATPQDRINSWSGM